MKSAYELAMERLEKASPSTSLTDEQKQALAEIDVTFKARIAEKELFLKDLISKARATGKLDEVSELEDQFTRELRRLNDDWETKKQKARDAQRS
jgi:hypothetical protein